MGSLKEKYFRKRAESITFLTRFLPRLKPWVSAHGGFMRFSWYGIRARIDALFHKIRHPSHKILWKTCADEICDGDITCETCNVIFWCRAQDLTQKELMRRIGEK